MLKKLNVLTQLDKIYYNKFEDIYFLLRNVLVYEERIKFNNKILSSNAVSYLNNNYNYLDNFIFDDKYLELNTVDNTLNINDYFINILQLRIREYIINNIQLSFSLLQYILIFIRILVNNDKKINNNFINNLRLNYEHFLSQNNINYKLKIELCLDFLENNKNYSVISYNFYEVFLYFLYMNEEFLCETDKLRYIIVCFNFDFMLDELMINDNLFKSINNNLKYFPNYLLITAAYTVSYLINYKYSNDKRISITISDELITLFSNIINIISNRNNIISSKYLYLLNNIYLLLSNNYFITSNNINLFGIKNIINNRFPAYNTKYMTNYIENDIKKHLDYCKINYQSQIYINNYISIDFLIRIQDVYKLIIEIYGPVHYYKSTNNLTAKTKYKNEILKNLKYDLLTINYEDWYFNKGIGEKNEYLMNIIQKKLSENS